MDPAVYGPPESAITKEVLEGQLDGMSVEEVTSMVYSFMCLVARVSLLFMVFEYDQNVSAFLPILWLPFDPIWFHHLIEFGLI